jgi:hypothetical protein
VPHNSKATYGGMVYNDMKLMVLTNLASGGASWRVLCLSRSSFAGSGVGVVIVRKSVQALG